MAQAWFIDAKGVKVVMNFNGRGEAAQFVRGCIKLRIKAQMITADVTPQGNFGGYGGVDRLRPVHCL